MNVTRTFREETFRNRVREEGQDRKGRNKRDLVSRRGKLYDILIEKTDRQRRSYA